MRRWGSWWKASWNWRRVLRLVRKGYCAAFTPDGPRGPRQVALPGVLQAALLAGVPIVPVAFVVSKKKF